MSVFAGRRARRGLATAVAVLAGAALPANASADTQDCNPLALKTCLAPFPSNYWAVADASSPTGLRGEVDDSLLRPELLRQLPLEDGISPSGIFNGAAGFSAGAGAVFEFTERQPRLPADGGDHVIAYDIDAGERIPLDAFLSGHARNPLVVGAKQSNVLQVFARGRWPFRHRVLVAVTTRMGAGDPTFPELAAKAAPGTKAAAYVGDVHDAIEQAGLDPAEVRTATLFTVRDREEATGPTERLLADTAARPHPTRNVRVRWGLPLGYTAGVVTGEVRLDNYRTRGGRGPVDFSGATRADQWVPFRLTLPRTAGTRPAPLVMYAHGVTSDKESADLIVAQTNAKLGLATIGIDWPNHGERARADGGHILELLSPRDLGTMSGLFNQGTMDQMGLYKAIGEMQLDVMRRPRFLNPLGRGGDGRPDLRTSSISMEGTSLGGVLGGNFAALAPKLDFVSFHVHGHSLARVISRTVLWNVFGAALPAGRTGTEDVVLQAALAQELDPSDGINTVDFMRNPRPGQTKKPLQMLVGDGDAIVPNEASTSVANLLDIPLVGQQRFAMPGVRSATQADPDGYELRQYPPVVGPLPIPGASETTAHLSFIWPATRDAQASFIRKFGPQP
jgi:hypothetical protein